MYIEVFVCIYKGILDWFVVLVVVDIEFKIILFGVVGMC